MRPDRKCTEPSKCRSCGAEVLWVEWKRSGKRMPIDAKPAERRMAGMVVVDHRPADNKLIAEKFDGANPEHAKRPRVYESHFATCPNPEQHRKP